jgi:hypothetical protein
MSRRSRLWLAASLAGLALFCVFLQHNSLNAPLDRDEGTYAYSAWLITQGQVPYRDTLEQKPPLIYLPYLAAIALNAEAYWPPRLMAAISFLLTVLLIGLAAGKEYGRRAGLIAMWLAPPLIMLPYLLPFSANTEKFLILPLTGLLAIYVYNRKTKSAWPWFWAGVCAALAVLYKQIALPLSLYIILAWAVTDRQQGRLTLKLGAALLGGLLTAWLVMGYFIGKAGWAGIWDQLVVYNIHYAGTFGGFNPAWLIKHGQALITAWPLLFVLFIWYWFRRPAHWLFYTGLFIIGWMASFNTPYAHYLIIMMPVWAVIAAAALDSLGSRLAVALTVVMIVALCWPARAYYFLSPAGISAEQYGPLNPFVESPLIARRITELTGPRDKVFIAGTEPQIMFYAKRFGVSRHGGMYGLMIDQPQAREYQRELIGALEKERPPVIAYVRSPRSWFRTVNSPVLIFEYLEKLLRTEYVLLGGTVRHGDRARWEEPLQDESLPACGLLLYRRK